MTQQIDIDAVGMLPRSRGLQKGRERRLRSFNKRLPYRLIVIADPLLRDPGSQFIGETRDSQYLLQTLWAEWENGAATEVRCDFSRQRNINRAGGRVPVDEPVQHLQVYSAGDKPPAVNVTNLCTIMGEPGEGLYTIVGIGNDRLRYFTIYSLEEFGHRARSSP